MRSSRERGRPSGTRRGRLIVAIGLAITVRALLRRLQRQDLRGEVALVTGGSRGLGLLIARELADQGCQVAICARDQAELERARAALAEDGIDALAVVCDVADREDTDRLLARVTERFGRIDILVNNAGIIQVEPLQTTTPADIEHAMAIIFWGTVNPTLALLPRMLERRSGRIVNITSIGGEVSVPRLLPYSAAKHAARAFSEGLYAELGGTGVAVTTVVPGTMRTGSHVNALFKGRLNREFSWFSLDASLPLLSMNAERAAAQIVNAVRRRDAYIVLSVPATLLGRVRGLFPGATVRLLALANRFLLPPDDSAGDATMARGMEIEAEHPSRLRDTLTGLGRSAAQRFNEYPGAADVAKEAEKETAARP